MSIFDSEAVAIRTLKEMDIRRPEADKLAREVGKLLTGKDTLTITMALAGIRLFTEMRSPSPIITETMFDMTYQILKNTMFETEGMPQ